MKQQDSHVSVLPVYMVGSRAGSKDNFLIMMSFSAASVSFSLSFFFFLFFFSKMGLLSCCSPDLSLLVVYVAASKP